MLESTPFSHKKNPGRIRVRVSSGNFSGLVLL